MAPLVPIFPTEALPERVNVVYRGWKEKRRKGPQIDLDKCELREMLQYSCNPPQDGIPSPGVVVCKPVLRLFRRYVQQFWVYFSFSMEGLPLHVLFLYIQWVKY